jgi:hypothetical protein
MLESYQHAIESLLRQDSYPGVLAEDFELFKRHFKSSAYTCRLRYCPRATLGFDSNALRRQHEIGHIGGFRCTFPNCQYPPYRTEKTLRDHVESCHQPIRTPKSIRQLTRTHLHQEKALSSLDTTKNRKSEYGIMNNAAVSRGMGWGGPDAWETVGLDQPQMSSKFRQH